MKDLSFVIPFRSDAGPRERAYWWLVSRLEQMFPCCPIIVGDHSGNEFNRSKARNHALHQVDTKYVAMVDADTVWDVEIIEDAIEQLEKDAPWVIPFNSYCALTPESSDWLLSKEPNYMLCTIDDEFQYEYIKSVEPTEIYQPVGGIQVFRMDDMRKIGGYDESFKGWGFEDREIVIIADREIGPHVRSAFGKVYHLWHPRGDADVHQPNYQENWRLFDEAVANVRERKNYL